MTIVSRIAQKTKNLQLLGLVLTLGLMGCQRSSTSAVDEKGETLFSNRPSEATQYLAVIRLKSAPLFQGSELEKGRAVVSDSARKQLDEEQAQFLEQLKTLAPSSRVVYRYRFVLNGFALTGPIADLEKLQKVALVTSIEKGSGFARPRNVQAAQGGGAAFDLNEINSVKFIGADKLHSRKIKNSEGQLVPLDGTGMRVGVLDTGIDFTHSMLGGAGSEDLFKSINPDLPTEAFPNQKVVGGIDLVGTSYDSGSLNFDLHIPRPDPNPLDEGGHGTHVAGSIAGVGDGKNTYSGVAPGASLYAVKVFGKEGSTSDAVVIAGLEYAADPNQDGNSQDQLDVVNLSLGGPFGGGKILYAEAVRNLARGGTVVVASAGNEGDVDYVTGAPASSADAISVAASFDNEPHNWQFAAVVFETLSQGEVVVEAIEATISKPISKIGDVQGKLVDVGLADEDLSTELADKVRGHVALIRRGKVTFEDKIRRAQAAGAIGVVVVNNQPGPPLAMGGKEKYEIPAIMVTQAFGEILYSDLKKGEVRIRFKTPETIKKPELIDTITGFSSKGPRSEDSLIKPEITAPGGNIISAEMGKGTAGVKMSGTSMSGPHIAGAMTLLKQAFSERSVADLKGLLLNRAKTLKKSTGEVEPISRQGSGRVQIDASVDALVLTTPATLSLGEVSLETRKELRREIEIENLSKEEQKLQVKFVSRGKGLELLTPVSVQLQVGETRKLVLKFALNSKEMTELVREMDGWVVVEKDGTEVSRVPVLAVARKISNLAVQDFKVDSSAVDAAGSSAQLTLVNRGKNQGEALLFNLLARDERKKDAHLDADLSKACDLQSVGYRIIEKTIDEEHLKVLQIAAKLYEPLTHWKQCELTVLIDANGDQSPEQELAAVTLDNVPGLENPAKKYSMASALFDARVMREARKKFEVEAKTSKEKVKENYASAVLDLVPMQGFDHSTIVIVEADLSKLARRATGELAIKVAVQELGGTAVESDDFLGSTASKWLALSTLESSQSFVKLPESVKVAPGTSQIVEFEKGFGTTALMVLMPQNLTVFSDVLKDQQQAILKPGFQQASGH